MKTLRKLTHKNLRLNKSRTLVSVIGILLSTALITVVMTMITSAQQTALNYEIHLQGDYHLELWGDFDSGDYKNLCANRDIESVSMNYKIGVAEMDNPRSKYTEYSEVVALSENAFEDVFQMTLSEGRFPKNSNEIVIPEDYGFYANQAVKLGDTVTLNIGSCWDSYVAENYDLPKDAESVMDYAVDSNYVDYTDKTFVREFTNAYTVVGILDNIPSYAPGYTAGSVPVYTVSDFNENVQRSVTSKDTVCYLKLYRADKYIDVVSNLTGFSRDDAKVLINGAYDDAEGKVFEQKLAESPLGIRQIYQNSPVISLESQGGFFVENDTMRLIYHVAVIVIAIVITASIFIMRNSFSISVSSKNKLYGMMSTVGATPRQIRNNVFYEGFILAVFGIPLGVGLGIGVSAILVQIINALMSGVFENGLTFAFKIKWFGIAAAVVIGVGTIFFSSLSSAIRASKISPIEAIRENREINIRRKQSDRSYRTPKLIGRLFGMGGSIAWKNLKRSRRQYRTTVISIIVSVAVYISIYSFMQSCLTLSADYFGGSSYNTNMSVEYREDDLRIAKSEFEQIAKLYTVDYSIVQYTSYGYHQFVFAKSDLYDDVKREQTALFADPASQDGDTMTCVMQFIAFDDDTYSHLVSSLGYNPEETKDKGLLCNYTTIQKDEITDDLGNVMYYDDMYRTKYLKNAKGKVLKGTANTDSVTEEKYQSVEIELAGEYDRDALDYDDDIELNAYSVFSENGMILVSFDWFQEHIAPNQCSALMQLHSSDGIKTEEQISNMSLAGLVIWNYAQQASIMRSLILLIEIFVYGFILVVTLIGVTNVFNTISTNTRLRSKEFAMLQSVGMTGGEFNRMIRLESIFYAVKALVIGIPIGLLLGYTINYQFNNHMNHIVPFQFPLAAVIISIAAVLGIVWLIMQISIVKIKKQNIIETIRRDNI